MEPSPRPTELSRRGEIASDHPTSCGACAWLRPDEGGTAASFYLHSGVSVQQQHWQARRREQLQGISTRKLLPLADLHSPRSKPQMYMLRAEAATDMVADSFQLVGGLDASCMGRQATWGKPCRVLQNGDSKFPSTLLCLQARCNHEA